MTTCKTNTISLPTMTTVTVNPRPTATADVKDGNDTGGTFTITHTWKPVKSRPLVSLQLPLWDTTSSDSEEEKSFASISPEKEQNEGAPHLRKSDVLLNRTGRDLDFSGQAPSRCVASPRRSTQCENNTNQELTKIQPIGSSVCRMSGRRASLGVDQQRTSYNIKMTDSSVSSPRVVSGWFATSDKSKPRGKMLGRRASLGVDLLKAPASKGNIPNSGSSPIQPVTRRSSLNDTGHSFLDALGKRSSLDVEPQLMTVSKESSGNSKASPSTLSRWSILRNNKGRIRDLKVQDTDNDPKGISKQKNSLYSVVGHVMFKKLYIAELEREAAREYRNKVQPKDPESSESESEFEIEVHDANPRFGATLSSAAQIATLKCYEDMLVDTIKSPSIHRLKTPSFMPCPNQETVDSHQPDKPMSRRSSVCMSTAIGLLDKLKSDSDGQAIENKKVLKSFNKWSNFWRTDDEQH